MQIPVFIGYDDREHEAYEVCRYSILTRTDANVAIKPLKHLQLRAQGYFDRPWRIDEMGRYSDERDGKPFSTQFSHTRFLVPFLAKAQGYTEWAIFMDCDMLVLDDIAKVVALADPHYAVMCVQHLHEPSGEIKMDGQMQTRYRRKNWSSFVLWNLNHSSNSHLTQVAINNKPGGWLHAFSWLGSDEIGALPEEWNYLVGHSVIPEGKTPKVIHYTEGGPWFVDKQDVPYGALWIAERNKMKHPPITATHKLKENANG